MAVIDDLRAQQREKAKEIRQLGDKFNEQGEEWKDDQEQTWNSVNEQYNQLLEKIEAEESKAAVASRMSDIQDSLRDDPVENPFQREQTRRQNQARRELSRELRGRSDEEIYSAALSGWLMRHRGSDLRPEQVEAARYCGLSLDINNAEMGLRLLSRTALKQLQRQWVSTPEHRRDVADFYMAPLTTTTGSSGGNIIQPETLLRTLEINMIAWGGIREVADVIQTASGETLSWPTADDTANTGRLIAESTAADDNAGGGSPGDGGPNPTFGKVQWGAYKYTSDTILVPYELLEDAVFELAPILGEMMGVRLGRITSTHFTTGTGTGQPQGVVTAAASGVTAASGSAIASDELIDLQHSVSTPYRMGARFAMNDSVAAHIRKIKDANNNYLWEPSFQSGQPDMILGSPVTIIHEMASIALNAKVVLFGDLSRYKIRRVNQVRMYQNPWSYLNKDQTGFVSFVREDGGLLDAGTTPVKYLQMAAA